MTSKKPIKAPDGLKEAGTSLWTDVTGTYDLRSDELRVLEGACREADLIARLDEALRDDTLVKRGSQGQPVINPLVSELRQHRSTFAAMVRQLKLPDENDTPEERSNQARSAANARWAKRA